MQVQKEQETWITHKNVEYINDWSLMIIRDKKTYKILSQLQLPGKNIAIFMVHSEITS